MRIVRTAAGMLLLTIGLPVLLVGGALWTAMQHRDAEGAFSGRVERITTPGHALVVPDLDALLRRDAPFTRAGDTRLRVTARTEAGPALVGIAPAEDVARYLAGAAYAQVDRVSLTAGSLPVGITPVEGTAVPAAQPAWQAAGVGGVGWASSEVRGQRLALVVMHPDASAGMTVDLRVEVRPGWLPPVTWGLLMAGAVLAVLGMATLAWPTRRPVVARPATLADVLTPAASVPTQVADRPHSGWAAPTPMPVQPILAWPPHPSAAVTPAPLPASVTPVPVSGAAVAADPVSDISVVPAPASAVPVALGPVLAELEMDGSGPGEPVSSASGGVPGERRAADEPSAHEAADAAVVERVRAEPEAPGPDLPGSADLASALGTLGTASRSTRRRKTAAGLPADTSVPPIAPPAVRRKRK